MLQPSGQTKRYFRFTCDCGNTVDALLNNVTSSKIKSCGCYNEDRIRKHGETGNPLVKVWYGMHERCNNRPNYVDRGIAVCSAWSGDTGLLNFLAWAVDKNYEPELEIDRRNNDAGYNPDNCRFVTQSVNQRNKRGALLVQHPTEDRRVSLITLWEEEGNPSLSWGTVRHRYLYLNWDAVSSISRSVRGSE